jgi:hypothetical protein
MHAKQAVIRTLAFFLWQFQQLAAPAIAELAPSIACSIVSRALLSKAQELTLESIYSEPDYCSFVHHVCSQIHTFQVTNNIESNDDQRKSAASMQLLDGLASLVPSLFSLLRVLVQHHRSVVDDLGTHKPSAATAGTTDSAESGSGNGNDIRRAMNETFEESFVESETFLDPFPPPTFPPAGQAAHGGKSSDNAASEGGASGDSQEGAAAGLRRVSRKEREFELRVDLELLLMSTVTVSVLRSFCSSQWAAHSAKDGVHATAKHPSGSRSDWHSDVNQLHDGVVQCTHKLLSVHIPSHLGQHLVSRCLTVCLLDICATSHDNHAQDATSYKHLWTAARDHLLLNPTNGSSTNSSNHPKTASLLSKAFQMVEKYSSSDTSAVAGYKVAVLGVCRFVKYGAMLHSKVKIIFLVLSGTFSIFYNFIFVRTHSCRFGCLDNFCFRGAQPLFLSPLAAYLMVQARRVPQVAVKRMSR